jgi:hypothetical protein
VTLAPSTFGRFGGDILVGNFGNGHINGYDPVTGHHLGSLRTAAARPLVPQVARDGDELRSEALLVQGGQTTQM